MNRPSSRLSSIATLDAIAAGWPFGRLTVPVQSLMFFVAGTRLARNTAQSVMVSAVSVTCSPTYASVKPSRSARMIASRSSLSVCA
jgi:hypothetical protein